MIGHITLIALYAVGAIAGWIAAGVLNRICYERLFDTTADSMDGGFITALGPIGTLLLGFCAGLMGLTWLCRTLGDRWCTASNITLILVSIFIPWIGSGIANCVWYKRLFPDSPAMNDLDLLIAFGPIGSFMLLLVASLMGFEKLCSFLAAHFSRS